MMDAVADSCEHGNEPTGSIKSREFTEQVSHSGTDTQIGHYQSSYIGYRNWSVSIIMIKYKPT
jgi:hypothetical protein